jgi:putative ABC transport system substrate-binding protein
LWEIELQFDKLRRREFVTLLGGAGAAWPLAARAQQSERVRRIGFLHDYNELDPDGRVQVVAFREALQKLSWTDGRNTLIEYRSGAADNELLRKYAAEIVAHEPDVVLTSGATITAALQRASRSLPIVFVNVTDPVGAGLVATLARPEAMPPALPNSSSVSAPNGWSCSKRSRRQLRG